MSNKSRVGKVAMLVAPRKFEVQEYNVPEINDDEILIKVEGCGVCGTDAHEFKGDPFGLIPVVLGHEGTGEIIEIGKNIKVDTAGQEVKVGDKLVTSVLTCGKCSACKTMPGRAELCDNLGVYGLFPDDEKKFNGYFSEYLIIRAGSSFFNVSDMNLDLRLLIEPSAVAVHAVERSKTTGLLKFDTKVVLQGCGPIGLSVLGVLRTMGIENIIVIDGNDSRLDLAKEFGAKYTFNFTKFDGFEPLLAEVKSVTGGIGADFGFQCTGVPAAAANLWKLVKRGGGLCEVGFFVNNGDCTINPHLDMCNKEISAVGSWVYTPQDYPTTFDYLRRAQGIGIPVEKLITDRFPLEKMNEALETNLKMTGIKVCFVNDKF